MREYKFRAWDSVCNIFIDPYAFVIDNSGSVYRLHMGKLKSIDNIELSQFSGLKDKNGKEIYEGDIVKTNWDSGSNVRIIGTHPYSKQLMQIDYKRYLDNKNGESDIYIANDSRYANGGDAEVIGNIYENPELLTK